MPSDTAIEMEIGGSVAASDIQPLLDAICEDRMSAKWHTAVKWRMDSGFAMRSAEHVKQYVEEHSLGILVLVHGGSGHLWKAGTMEDACIALGLSFRAWIEEDMDGERSVRYWTPVNSGQDAGCRRMTADRQILVLQEDLWEDLDNYYVSVAEMRRTLKERFEPLPALPRFEIVEG